MDEHFHKIKGIYDDFHRFLLKQGRLPMGSTRVGFWGASVTSEIFRLFHQVGLKDYSHFLDLGSGDGRVVMIASLFTRASGIEFDGYLHSVAEYMKTQLANIPHTERTRFIQGNFYHYSLRDYDMIFINPDQPLDKGLERKLLDEMNGTLLVAGHHYHPKNLIKHKQFEINGTLFTLYRRF